MNERELLEYLQGKENIEKIYQELMAPESKEQLKQIWDNYMIELDYSDKSMNSMLDRIHDKLDISDQYEHRKSLMLRLYAGFKRVAAVLFIPLFLSTTYFLLSPLVKKDAGEPLLEITTLPGTITQMVLSDSSKVWLNQSTKFRYPKEFANNQRDVFVLDGEAYFEVKSDKEHPFVVNTPLMKTVATGTKFNIGFSSKHGYFEAALVEGKITLENKKHKITMNPGSITEYNDKSNSLDFKENSAQNVLSWMDGAVIFENEVLENVLGKLERKFNVEFVVASDQLRKLHFTAKLTNESLEQFLANMKTSLPITYTSKVLQDPKRKVIYINQK